MAGPLSHLKVLELGGIGPVPHAGMVLADLGADVVVITRPGASADLGGGILHRGKRSVALDLRCEGGVGVALDLAERSDVLLEGFRPGVAERLGMGPGEVRERNRRLVYGRMTGWGQEGPLAGAAGHDINYVAASGALAAVGPAHQPYPPLNLVGDFGGGSMLLLVGVLSALHEAERSGEGQVVDAAMVDGIALLMAMHHGGRAEGWWNGERATDLLDGSAPFYTTYATSDGKWMAVGALEPQFFAALVDGLGLQSSDLPAQMDRAGWPELRRRFAAVFAGRSRQAWEEVFSGSDACVAGVYSMDEAPNHPHLRQREVFVDPGGVVQPAPAPRFSRTPPDPPPGHVRRPGGDTEAVLADLGYPAERVSTLRADGVIAPRSTE